MEYEAHSASPKGFVAVRYLTLLALALAACAQPGMPPGGPPDTRAPRVVRVLPDSNARNVRRSTIVVEFDEVVSERPRGAAALGDLYASVPYRSHVARVYTRRALAAAVARARGQPDPAE